MEKDNTVLDDSRGLLVCLHIFQPRAPRCHMCTAASWILCILLQSLQGWTGRAYILLISWEGRSNMTPPIPSQPPCRTDASRCPCGCCCATVEKEAAVGQKKKIKMLK